MDDLLRETVRSIRAHALRFALTSSGIIWGVAMLTYLSATMDGYDQHFSAQIDKVGQRIVFLFPGAVTKPHVGQRGARHVKLEIEDVERLATLDSIDRAAVNLWVGPRMFRAGRRTKLIWTWGASQHTAAIVTDENLANFRGGQLTEMGGPQPTIPRVPARPDSSGRAEPEAPQSEDAAASETSIDPETYWRGRVLRARTNWASAVEETKHLEGRIAE